MAIRDAVIVDVELFVVSECRPTLSLPYLKEGADRDVHPIWSLDVQSGEVRIFGDIVDMNPSHPLSATALIDSSACRNLNKIPINGYLEAWMIVVRDTYVFVLQTP